MMPNDFFEINAPNLLPEKPVVSVLMITYNHEKYLGQAIDGVVSQIVDFPIELIIGEDCSSDKTRDIALEYQKKYPNFIRVIYSDSNVGPTKNFSRTLSLCKGEYVAVCDGDDVWVDRKKLTKQVTFLSKNPEYVVTYHDYLVFNNVDNITNKSKLPDSCKRDFTKSELQRGAFLLTLTLCFRNVVRTLPDEFFRVLNGDTFLISLLGEYGSGHYMHDLKPGVYRKHPGGIWSMLEQHEKQAKLSATYYWLSVYYQRVGRQDLVNDFIIQMLTQLDDVVKIDIFTLMRFSARRIYRSGLRKIRTHALSPAKRFLVKCGVLSRMDAN